MVSSLVCAAILFATSPAQTQRQDLLRRLVPHPTGANGYEEYLRGAEIATDPVCTAFDTWVPDMEAPDPASAPAEKIQLLTRLSGMSALDVRKEEIKRFGEALELVRQGNQKSVVDPRGDLNPDSIFPELATFRRLARMFAADAYVKFSDGNSSAATKSLIDGFTFAYNISSGSMISTLVGISMTSILMAECSDRLSNLSLADCRNLEQFSDRLLKAPNQLAAAFQLERRMQLTTLQWMFTQRDFDLKLYFGNERGQADALAKRFSASTPEQRARWLQSSTVLVNGFYDATIQRVLGPEANWVGADADLQVWSRQENDPVVSSVANILFPVFDQACSAAARSRTQIRLLGLNARVLEFHWLNNRYPRSLSELSRGAAIKDPLSGEDFVYETRAGGYRLYSKGTKLTGEVELRYRAPLGSGGDDKTPLLLLAER